MPLTWVWQENEGQRLKGDPRPGSKHRVQKNPFNTLDFESRREIFCTEKHTNKMQTSVQTIRATPLVKAKVKMIRFCSFGINSFQTVDVFDFSP